MGKLAETVATMRKTVSMCGPELARTMMIAQLPVAPSAIPHHKVSGAHRKPSSLERRRAKIAAGKMAVVDGALVGPVVAIRAGLTKLDEAMTRAAGNGHS